MCKECYSNNNRIAPLLNPLDCLENHTQYICGTYGRCICIEHAQNRGLRVYLRKNKDKSCETMVPVFQVEEYKEYPNTQIWKLTFDKIQKYMAESLRAYITPGVSNVSLMQIRFLFWVFQDINVDIESFVGLSAENLSWSKARRKR